jgi:shikimate kinase
MNIVLIGYRCCGKTSTGKLLAEKLGRKFVDTDDLVIEKTGCTISEMVERNGWHYFRDLERDVVKELSAMDGLVIATGGGIVTNEVNIENLKVNGFVVWLYADIDTIKKRLNEDWKSTENRPSLTGGNPSDEIKKVVEQRKPLYTSASDMAVDTTKLNINEVADMIVEKMRKQERGIRKEELEKRKEKRGKNNQKSEDRSRKSVSRAG